MIQIELSRDKEEQFLWLAQARGESASRFAQIVLEHYIDFQAWPADSEEAWAAASERLAAEVMSDEDWSEGAANGSR